MALTKLVEVPASQVSMLLSGHVQDAIATVHVDAFGGDPTGATDSTAAALAAIQSVTAVTDSSLDQSVATYARLVFGRGTYVLKDLPLMTGWAYVGQGDFATRIVPAEGASWCFTTTGTTNVDASTSDMRMFNSSIADMNIGPIFVFSTHANALPKVSGAGGVLLKSCSYFTMRNVTFGGLDREALHCTEVFDSNFYNLRIRYCGSQSGSKYYPGLYMGPDGAFSSTNAVNFFGLHIEHCIQHMVLDLRCRHVFIYGLKSEGDVDTMSSVITGVNGVTFVAPELTWQRSDIPQFNMASGSVVGDITVASSYGVSFLAPQCISAPSTRGWYFHYVSTQSKLLVSDLFARYASKLIDGSNVSVQGGVAHLSGPVLFSCVSDFTISDFRSTRGYMKSGTIPVLLAGLRCTLRNSTFDVAGTDTSINSGVVGVGAGAVDASVTGVDFAGMSGTAILLGNQTARDSVYNNRILAGATYSTLVRNGTDLHVLTTGVGVGGMVRATATIAAGASATLNVVGEGCYLIVQAYDTSNASHMCSLFGAYGSTSLVIDKTLNSFFSTAAPSSGSGVVHLTKALTSAGLVCTNNTSTSITVNVVALSAVVQA